MRQFVGIEGIEFSNEVVAQRRFRRNALHRRSLVGMFSAGTGPAGINVFERASILRERRFVLTAHRIAFLVQRRGGFGRGICFRRLARKERVLLGSKIGFGKEFERIHAQEPERILLLRSKRLLLRELSGERSGNARRHGSPYMLKLSPR